MAGLRADRLRQCIGHRPMREGTQEPALAVHGEVTRRPDRWRAYVTAENRLRVSALIEHARHILRMGRLFAVIGRCQFVQALACFPIVLERLLQMGFVWVLLQLWQQGPERRLCIPYEAEVKLGATSELL